MKLRIIIHYDTSGKNIRQNCQNNDRSHIISLQDG